MLSAQSEGTPLTHAEPAHHLVRLLGWCGHAVRNSIQPPMTRSGSRVLFDHLVGECEHVGRNSEAQSLSGPEVDDELKLGRLLYREIGGLFTFENAARIGSRL